MNRIVLAVLGYFLIFNASADSSAKYPKLWEITKKSLEINIRKLDSGYYVSAGNERLTGFWTRDFYFSARGLYPLGRLDVIKSELTSLFRFMRAEDGCLPRSIHGPTNAKHHWWDKWLRKLKRIRPVPKDPLGAIYEGGGGTPLVIDSNALALLGALEYVERSGDHPWWNEHLPEFVKAYRFYDRHLKDGLIHQIDFSDWQDSVRRKGPVFFANLAYAVVSERLMDYPEFNIKPEEVAARRQRLMDTFFDSKSGLFHSMPGYPYTSLEDNLLVIDWGFFPPASPEAQSLFHSLKAHPLWTKNGVPGFPTYPNYPVKWVGHVFSMGLRHYHDAIYWSWLMGLSAKVALEMNDKDSADLIFVTLQKMAVRDGSIAEIYFSNPPFRRFSFFLSKAEKPFAWGSGLILDAMAY